MRSKIYFLSGLLIFSTLLTSCAGGASAQTTTPAPEGQKVTRTVSVTGSGKAILTPDIAYVTIGVHTENKNASEAVSANNSQTEKVIAAIKQQGVDEKDIQTTNFSIYPQQQYDPNGKPTGEITYIVDNSVYVTIRDLDKVGDVLDAAVQAGANSISGIQFDVADKTEALSEARQAAVNDARAKAEELATAAGVTLGDVQTISEGTGVYPVPMYDMRASAPMAAEAASVPISPGQMTLTVDVSMVYEIR
jgi:hypothetical protein